MVNGYNARVRSSYTQYGNGMPMPMAVPMPTPMPMPPQMNVSHRTYNTAIKNTTPQQQPVINQTQPQVANTNQTEEKKNSLWEIIKSDKAAIITGTVVSLAAILTMILFAKNDPAAKSSKNWKNTFAKIKNNIKTKWTNYRTDYKARMAAKAPEHCYLTPNIIR